MNLSASQEIIAFIITILGLVLVILKLFLSTKQLKQQARIDKKQLEEEKQFLLSVAEEENKKEQQASDLYKKTVQSVLKYIHEELSEYVKKEELSTLDKGLRKFIERKMNTLPKTEAALITKELKSLQDAFQINPLDAAYEPTGTPEIFFRDRVERRYQEYLKKNT
jgi:hypothetical protein